MKKRLLVAIDVDSTLIDSEDQPREDIVELVKLLSPYVKIMVWSGGGKDYAEMWVRRLGLEEYVLWCEAKTDEIRPDLALDDEEYFNMADKVIIV